MRIFKLFGARVLAAALAFAVIPAAVPSNVPVVGISKAEAQERYYRGGREFRGGRDYGERRSYRGGRSYYRDGRGYRGGRYYGNRRYYGRRSNGGAAIAGAIVGLGVGAAIASANQPRYYRAAPAYGGYAVRSDGWYEYCASRYRSFDPRSGTYQPYNGPRRLCR